MRIAFIHLSDIHFREGKNWLSDKSGKLAGAVHADDPTTSAYAILFSGDVAFSGSKNEYLRASQFTTDLKSDLAAIKDPPSIMVSMVPGNHDCDFSGESDTRQMAISQMAPNLGNMDLEGDIARQCVAVQDEFFSFAAAQTHMPVPTTPDRFFSSTEQNFGGFKFRINLYNTAWLSRKNEKQGELLFPVSQVGPLVARFAPADLVLSVLHHPYNWLSVSNARELRKLIESTSDIVLTGHEHEAAIYSKQSLCGPELRFFEGAVLQTDEGGDSGFNILHVDTATRQYRLSTFFWKSGLYTQGEASEWAPIHRNSALSGDQFDNTPEYDKALHDIGTGFSHPHMKSGLRRTDLFVYPDLIRRALKSDGGSRAGRVVESRNVLAQITESKLVVIAGSDLSGKTTLAKSLYCDLKTTSGLVPLAISGRGLEARNQTEVQRLVDAAVTAQYGSALVVPFGQLGADRKALIIDDFDQCSLNPKGQRLFLDVVRRMFDMIVITADDFFALEELSQEAEDNRLLYDFDSFEIREFGFRLRGKLIEKWVVLGREHSISKSDLDHEVAAHEHLIGSLLGRNLLPSHPLIILTVLQAWEANQSHDTTTGSYGYLYETLILQALSTAGFKAPDIDVIMTFLSRVAYRMFALKKEDLSEVEIGEVAKDYFEYYRTRLPQNILRLLSVARVLHEDGKQYCFRYPYYFYFFVARYLRDNMRSPAHQSNLSELVKEMADHVHYEQYANVLSFYVYLSKDADAIAAILANAKRVYEEHPPCDFDSTVAYVNRLYGSGNRVEPLRLPASSPETNRDEYKRELDKGGDVRDEGLELRRNEKIKYDKQLSDIIKINIATKTLQILGQVIRNSPGSLPGDVKREVAAEAYLLGLRTMTAVLSIPGNNLDSIRRYLMDMIREYRAAHNKPDMLEADLQKMADEGVIQLAQAYAYGMLRRISQAVGLKQLEDIYAEVLRQHDGSISVRLIDLAIKLDHFAGAPLEEIVSLDADLKPNHYAHKTLQDLVFGFLYLRDVDYKTRSKLMSRFKIQGGVTQKLVDNPSKRERI